MMNIQELTDYSIDDVPNIMEVRTDKLSPVQSSTYRHTFRLDESGFLDKNTLLLFKARKNAGTTLRFNCWNGCLGAIKRVILRCGDFTLQDLDKAGLWASLNHLYKASPDNQNKFFSHYLHNQLFYQVVDDSTQTTAAATFGDAVKNGSIVPDTSFSGIRYGAATDGAAAAVNACEITGTAADNFQNAIPLGLLLPALMDTSLPLFLFQNYRINLIVEFDADASQYCNDIGRVNYAAGDNCQAALDDLRFDEVELLQDILVYPSSVQEKYQERTLADGGYNLDFINVNTIEKQVQEGSANTTQSIEHRLNVTGEEVHYVEAIRQLGGDSGNNGANKVLLGQRADGVSIESFNFVVNGVETYPNPYSNPLSLYNQMSYALKRDLQVVKPLYVNDPSTEFSLLSAPQTGLAGKYKPIGLDLQNGNFGVMGAGTMIGQYPIIVRYTRKPHEEITKTIDLNAGTIIANDEKGIEDCIYFVGTTRIANIKTMSDGSQSVVVAN